MFEAHGTLMVLFVFCLHTQSTVDIKIAWLQLTRTMCQLALMRDILRFCYDSLMSNWWVMLLGVKDQEQVVLVLISLGPSDQLNLRWSQKNLCYTSYYTSCCTSSACHSSHTCTLFVVVQTCRNSSECLKSFSLIVLLDPDLSVLAWGCVFNEVLL